MIRSLLRTSGVVLLLLGALLRGSAEMPTDLWWPVMRWFFGGLVGD